MEWTAEKEKAHTKTALDFVVNNILIGDWQSLRHQISSNKWTLFPLNCFHGNNSIYEVNILTFYPNLAFTKLELHNRCWSRRNELVVWVGYIFSNAIHMNFDFLPPLKRHTLNLSAHSDRFVKISFGKLPVLAVKEPK